MVLAYQASRHHPQPPPTWHTEQTTFEYKVLNDKFNFDATSLAPLWTLTLFQIKPSQKALWGLNTEPAYYVGPTINHCHCCKVVMKHTWAEQITNTLTFWHHFTVPTIATTNRLVQATNTLQQAITIYLHHQQIKNWTFQQWLTLKHHSPSTTAVPAPTPAKRICTYTNPTTTCLVLATTPSPVDCHVLQHPLSTAHIPITQDDEEWYTQQDSHNPLNTTEDSPTRCTVYNLCNQAVHVAANACLLPTWLPSKYGAAIQLLQAKEIATTHCEIPPSMCNAIFDDNIGQSLVYRDLIKLDKYNDTWLQSFANELGCLVKDVHNTVGTTHPQTQNT